MIPYSWFKQLAFTCDPERAHALALKSFSLFPNLCTRIVGARGRVKTLSDRRHRYQVESGGLRWPFPVALAAGLDKNAQAIDFFSQLPFGAIEVGTVTPLPQEGNEKPRLFRLTSERSLRNHMGFNSEGADRILKNIVRSGRHGKILGINLGKNKQTPLGQAWKDYVLLYQMFSPLADYLVLNLSSPNTRSLRDLQHRDSLRSLLASLKEEREKSPCPLYLKISPDLSKDALPSLVDLAVQEGLTGLIATNTTVIPERGEGGISGQLLHEKAKEIRGRALSLAVGTGLDIIGCGGISHFDDLWEFWKLGGKTVQIYTAFIYQGPPLLMHIASEIEGVLALNGAETLEELLSDIQSAQRGPQRGPQRKA